MRYMDYHMHTAASEDSEAPIAAMLDEAVNRGIEAVAVTDHVEMTGFRKGGYDVTAEESWNSVRLMRPLYEDRLRVAQGIELGQPLYDLAQAQAVLAAHPYDFVLASQHRLGEEEDYYFMDFTGLDIGMEMDAYFDAVLDMVAWGGFHALAHLTYPFRYIPKDRRPQDYRRWQDRIDCILRRLAEKGLALEINTSGMRDPKLRMMHPDYPIVRRFRELGGELITVGSDAHKPGDVGAHIADALSMAKKAGFAYTAVYWQGKAEMVKIDI